MDARQKGKRKRTKEFCFCQLEGHPEGQCRDSSLVPWIPHLLRKSVQILHNPWNSELCLRLRLKGSYMMDNMTDDIFVSTGVRFFQHLDGVLARSRRCLIFCLRGVLRLDLMDTTQTRLPSLPTDIIRYIDGLTRKSHRDSVTKLWEFVAVFPVQPNIRFDLGLGEMIIKRVGWP